MPPDITLTGIRGEEGNNEPTETTSEEIIILDTRTGNTYPYGAFPLPR